MRLLKKCLHWYIPLLWRGGRPMHFVMHAFNNHVGVLHNVTPIDLLVQSAGLSDGVVVPCRHGVKYMCRGRIELPIEPVGQSAILYVRPNATYLHDLYIHPSNLCKP